jgi:hypothetical protein
MSTNFSTVSADPPGVLRITTSLFCGGLGGVSGFFQIFYQIAKRSDDRCVNLSVEKDHIRRKLSFELGQLLIHQRLKRLIK